MLLTVHLKRFFRVEHEWHHQDRRRRDPRELTGIVDLTRGEDHPIARLSEPDPGKVWHRA